MNPVWQIVNSFSELQRSLAAMERVFEILGWERDKTDRPDARDAPSVVQEIRFDDVEFEYREGVPVVRDFTSRCAADRSSRSWVAVVPARRR
jgi:ATP-binding cassette subfamily B protein/subfamily B ATP-binding cassette protein MsbA